MSYLLSGVFLSGWSWLSGGLAWAAPEGEGAAPPGAADLAGVALPPELEAWRGWLEARSPDLRCAPVAAADKAEAVCRWPGLFVLEAGPAGGRFALGVRMDRAGLVPLPGGRGAWPQDVASEAGPVAVIDQGGVPTAVLPAGTWVLRGAYRWSATPQGLALPAEIGVLRLSVDGQAVAQPRIDAGMLRLGAGEAPGESRLELDVMRRVRDGVPAVIETRIDLRASGGSREVSLGRALLEGTRAVSLAAQLPARLGPEGDLVVQVRPGTWTITLEALHTGEIAALTAPTLPAPWPEVEYWSVQADEQLRAINLSGPPGVDPGRTPLPAEWRALPAFRLGPGEALNFESLRRGQPKPPRNALTLRRELWLDHDGEGFTVRDALSGELHRGWRLDLSGPGALGQATVTVDGSPEDQVITAGTGGTGVELRENALALQATSRLPGRAEIPAVGWSTDVDDLDVLLHLPPGWRLIRAGGADNAPGALLERWSLWGALWGLVLVAGAARAAGPACAAMLGAGLLLSEVSGVAPVIAWLPLLGALLLPTGRWFQHARRGALAFLAVCLIPGLYLDLERALLPHVGAKESAGSSVAQMTTLSRNQDILQDKEQTWEQQTANAVDMLATQTASKGRGEYGSFGSSDYRPTPKEDKKLRNISLQRDPNAVAQTGPGLPQWGGEVYNLSWDGQVRADQRLDLWVVSPGMMAIWRVAECMLLGLAALSLGRRRSEERWEPPAPPAEPPVAPAEPPVTLPAPALPEGAALPEWGGAGKAGVLVLALLAGAGEARAQEADRPMAEPAAPAELTELEAQLRRGLCVEGCVEVPRAQLLVGASGLTLVAEVHVAARGAWPLPGPTSAWVPGSVRVDGAESVALVRREDGFLHLRLEPGVHRVELSGPLPPDPAITLQFSLPPRWMEAAGEGWRFEGVRPDGSVAGSLQLIRTVQAEGAARAAELSPWLEVHRFLDLGFPWKVRTELRRVGASDRALTVSVPLLTGESVTDDGLVVKDGAVQVSLGREADRVEWMSTLDPAEALQLRAPEGVPWTEVWELSCSPVFACEAEGVPPFRHIKEGGWLPAWRPWPGESLQIRVRRPEAVPGQTLTIDLVEQAWDPGPRLLGGKLKIQLRSSQGGKLPIRLPEGAELQSVSVDGQSRPMEDRAGVLELPLRPGQQRWEIAWRQPLVPAAAMTIPAFDVGAPAVNVRVTVEPPPGRWLLYASSGPNGPALLWWARVGLLMLGAVAAARWIGVVGLAEWTMIALLAASLPLPAAGCLAFYGAVLRLYLEARAGRISVAPAIRTALLALSILGALCAVGVLLIAAAEGLLGEPDMLVTGPGSSRYRMAWFADQTEGALPQPTLISLPLWSWRLLFLSLTFGAGWAALRTYRAARAG